MMSGKLIELYPLLPELLPPTVNYYGNGLNECTKKGNGMFTNWYFSNPKEEE